MAYNKDVLSGVLDQLHEIGAARAVSIGSLAEAIGARSFATLMLVFALIAMSPASILPGVTTMVAVVEFLLVAQMIAGRRHIWLPDLLANREIPDPRLQSGVSWLRRPIAVVDHLLRPRLGFLTEKPCLYIWLFLVMALTLIMPFMELVPGTGTLASGMIALVAAAVLTRDGLLLLLAALCLGALIWMLRLLGEAWF